MSVNIDKNSECKNSGEFGYIYISWYISFSQIVSLAYYCYWHRKSPRPAASLRNDGGSIGEKAFQHFQCEIHLFCWQCEIHRAFRRQWQGRDTPSWSSLSNKLLGGRQPNTTLRESSKFWGLKSVDSKLCLNWRVWNEIPVSTVLCWQNGKYVLIPICDHYHYIKSQLSTPRTGPQKGRM